ncbi:MAG: tetratricopeptide repeat protein, partial [Bacteroidales bacterium]|nr:tetratricopeptide repeat protein [Bacteroidales bacterium]
MNRYIMLVFFISIILTNRILAHAKTSPENQTHGIVELLSEGENLLEDNPAQSLKLAEKVIRSLKNQESGIEYFKAIYLRGSAHSYLENYKKAIKDFNTCLTSEYYINDTVLLADLKFSMARCYDYLANFDSAFVFYRAALKLYQLKKNIYGQAKILQNLGIIESDNRRDSFAMLYYYKALDLYRLLGNKAKEA